MGPNKVPLLSSIVPKEEHNPVSVIVAQTMHIRERSELEILAIVKEGATNDGRTYLLKGLEGSKSLALVARAVVSPINNTVIVCVLNPQKDPIILHRNAKIAAIEEVDTVCDAAAAGSYKSEDSTQGSIKFCGKWVKIVKQPCQKPKKVNSISFYLILKMCLLVQMTH